MTALPNPGYRPDLFAFAATGDSFGTPPDLRLVSPTPAASLPSQNNNGRASEGTEVVILIGDDDTMDSHENRLFRAAAAKNPKIKKLRIGRICDFDTRPNTQTGMGVGPVVIDKSAGTRCTAEGCRNTVFIKRANHTRQGAILVEKLERLGGTVLNRDTTCCEDRAVRADTLLAKSVNVVTTIPLEANPATSYRDLRGQLGEGPSVFLKPRNTTDQMPPGLIHSRLGFEKYCDAAGGRALVAQRPVGKPLGRVTNLLVVDGCSIGVIELRSLEGWCSSSRYGALGEAKVTTPAVSNLANRAVISCGLDLAVVSVLTDRGRGGKAKVLGVDPRLEGIGYMQRVLSNTCDLCASILTAALWKHERYQRRYKPEEEVA